jgi:hypothetical protein
MQDVQVRNIEVDAVLALGVGLPLRAKAEDRDSKAGRKACLIVDAPTVELKICDNKPAVANFGDDFVHYTANIVFLAYAKRAVASPSDAMFYG